MVPSIKIAEASNEQELKTKVAELTADILKCKQFVKGVAASGQNVVRVSTQSGNSEKAKAEQIKPHVCFGFGMYIRKHVASISNHYLKVACCSDRSHS